MSGETLQHDYYARTARDYDEAHGGEDHEHAEALGEIVHRCHQHGWRTVLDVGCGTGRGVAALTDAGLDAVGIDPVPELLGVAHRNGIDPGLLRVGDGRNLPYEDDSFDVVVELGVLHHVAKPDEVIREMQRVARHAVFLSDSNRYGQGSLAAGLAKLALHKTRLWRPFDRVRTAGFGFHISEGDGIFYSYSVYDSVRLFKGWNVQVTALGGGDPQGRAWGHPLLTSPTLLVSARR